MTDEIAVLASDEKYVRGVVDELVELKQKIIDLQAAQKDIYLVAKEDKGIPKVVLDNLAKIRHSEIYGGDKYRAKLEQTVQILDVYEQVLPQKD